MELLLKSTENKYELNYNWDIDVVDGIALTVPEDAEADQEAAVVAYLEKTTVPLMEDAGVDWAGFLMKQRTLAEIDTEIRENIKEFVNSLIYSPVYAVEGDDSMLTVRLAKTLINTGATL